MRKGKDPDPYLWPVVPNPDPEGLQNYPNPAYPDPQHLWAVEFWKRIVLSARAKICSETFSIGQLKFFFEDLQVFAEIFSV